MKAEVTEAQIQICIFRLQNFLPLSRYKGFAEVATKLHLEVAYGIVRESCVSGAAPLGKVGIDRRRSKVQQ